MRNRPLLSTANLSDATPSPPAPLPQGGEGSETLNSCPLPFGGEGVRQPTDGWGLLGHRIMQLTARKCAIWLWLAVLPWQAFGQSIVKQGAPVRRGNAWTETYEWNAPAHEATRTHQEHCRQHRAEQELSAFNHIPSPQNRDFPICRQLHNRVTG